MSSPRRRTSKHRAGILLGMLLGTTSVLAQSYGELDQVLTLGAAAFRDRSLNGSVGSDGYNQDSGILRTPLSLPEGAELRQLCAHVNDPSSTADVTVSLIAVKLVPAGGGDPATATIPGTLVSSSGSIGYGYYCTDTLSVTIHDVFDVDGDGVPDAVVYYLEADVPSGQGLELGGVRVTWRRQVSPAPVAPTFGDVPASDGGFQFIEAMAASAITGGCGGGNYCPEAHVTRRQMAIFLAKALGLHWGN